MFTQIFTRRTQCVRTSISDAKEAAIMARQSWKQKIGYPHWNGYGNLTLFGAEHVT
jgi:hypothetical protein